MPIAIKASAPNSNGTTALAASDFQAIPGFSADNSMSGNVTDYSAAFSGTWNTSEYNDFTLNSNALSDLQNNSVIQIAIVNYTYDYLNVQPAFNPFFNNGLYYSDYLGTATDPIIDYTLGTAPQIAEIDGIAVGDYDRIIGGNISVFDKILGIDMP